MKQNKDFALAALQEYFDTFASNLEEFRIEPAGAEFYTQVIRSIDSFLPYRNELVDLFLTIARYRADSEAYETVHTFFERILPYGFLPRNKTTWKQVDADNFKFILHELFLYVTAAYLKNSRFKQVNELVERGFYFADGSPEVQGSGLVPFTFFNTYIRSLEFWNQQQDPGWLSPEGHLLKERATGTGVRFEDLMQAELVLFVRDALRPEDADYPNEQWYPNTLVYAADRDKPFELFARAQSTAFFGRMRIALGIEDKTELSQFIEDYRTGERHIPKWDHQALSSLPELINLSRIETRP